MVIKRSSAALLMLAVEHTYTLTTARPPEVGEAGIAVDDAMRSQRRVQLVG